MAGFSHSVRFGCTVSAAVILWSVVGCGSNARPVDPGQGSVPSVADSKDAKILLLNPRANNSALPSELMTGVGEPININYQLQGVSPERFSLGFRVPTNNVNPTSIRIAGAAIHIDPLAEGVYQIQLIARDRQGCERLSHSDCDVRSQAVADPRVYDLTRNVILRVIDPQRPTSTGQSEGGGIIGAFARCDGFLVEVAKAFMGAQDCDQIMKSVGGGNGK